MDEEVKGKVNGPGIFLLVVGILSLVYNLISAVWNLLVIIGQGVMMEFTAEGILALAWNGGFSLLFGLIGFFVSIVIIYGGNSLRNTRSPGAVYAGSIFAMLPCCVSCCCLLGLPAGIWALVVMQDEQVKQAFEETYY